MKTSEKLRRPSAKSGAPESRSGLDPVRFRSAQDKGPPKQPKRPLRNSDLSWRNINSGCAEPLRGPKTT